jgi:6,7-dimethyl-8-ribityllumazine synthase
VAILVSRYHERLTARLLDGARQAAQAAGVPEKAVEVYWVPGSFELGVAAAAAARSGRYSCLVALGVVVRGETPHFDYVAGAAARALADVARQYLIPVGFGVLTTDTVEQAEARAGGSAGNKGAEAMEAALEAAGVVARLLGPDGAQ